MDKAVSFRLLMPPYELDTVQKMIEELVHQELRQQDIYKQEGNIARVTFTRESVSGQSLDALTALIIAIGGGTGMAAIFVGIAKAIATVRDRNPNGKFKLSGKNNTLEISGYSADEIAKIIHGIVQPTSKDEQSHTVVGLSETDDRLLDTLYDPLTGEYSAPSIIGKDILPRSTLPANTSRVLCAILDTGVMTHHPWIRGKIKGYVDFTGEGIEDKNGHGTLVTLQYLASSMSLEGDANNLLIVKVLDEHRRGTEENLKSGLIWAANNGATFINLSLGIYRDSICDVDCELCSLVEKLSKAGITITLAAGNDPTKYTCPEARDTFTLKIGAANYEGSAIEGFSGPGAIFVAPGSRLQRLTANDSSRQSMGVADLPTLAGSLNTSGAMLSNLGRYEEALAASQQAIDIYRHVAETRPDSFLRYLAGSLDNLGITLAKLGRREEALAALEEAVQIYRRFAQTRRDAFPPNLAASLGALGQVLAASERHQEAAAALLEGLSVIEAFVERQPHVFGDLARALGRSYLKACEHADAEPNAAMLERIGRAVGADWSSMSTPLSKR